ncbi:hypothetical protein [Almyronema epifaneia]|uniref:Plastid lipid-associated protein/fibrillin conserved domain-containing protein n=1 Tax=Almyronema epifaneia S1 TaxID=2991925 RepID=A0ABW6IA31_9CYAN
MTALSQAVAYLTSTQTSPPAAAAVVADLLLAEKAAKSSPATYPALWGTWRLGFVTGTRKARQRAGVTLGAGRFLPRWLNITITYEPTEPTATGDRAQVNNRVRCGPFDLQVSGPTRFWPQQRILAFDFTRLSLKLGKQTLYSGFIRQGQGREAEFYQQALKDQAFFKYFLIRPDCIAARGRGGGLALWVADR